MGKRARDNQKSKVYDWENEHVPVTGEELSLAQCEQLIRQALVWWFRDSMVSMPLIKNGKGTRIARGGATTINLPRWARNYGVVLHETSHCLVDRMGHNKDGGHGPYFMRTYIELLGHVLNMDKADLVSKARADKINVISPKHLNRPGRIQAIDRILEAGIRKVRLWLR